VHDAGGEMLRQVEGIFGVERGYFIGIATVVAALPSGDYLARGAGRFPNGA